MRRGADYPRKPGDYYPTPQETADVVLKYGRLCLFRPRLCDPCSGKGDLLRAFKRHGYKAVGSDIKDGFDFINDRFRWKDVDIVTNPPYGDRRATLSLAFIHRALQVTEPWRGKVAMLLPVDFDSGSTRRDIFADCPAFTRKIVLLDRVRFFRGQAGSANHAWFLWDHTNEFEPAISYAKQYDNATPAPR